MERDINSDDFEEFLQLKTEQYKIYPSDKSWKKIYQALHPGRSWLRRGGSLLLLTGFFFASQKIFFSNTDQEALQNKSARPLSNHIRTGTTPGISVDNTPAVLIPEKADVKDAVQPERRHTVELLKDVKAAGIVKAVTAFPETTLSLQSEHVINTENALSGLNITGQTSDLVKASFQSQDEDPTTQTALSSLNDESPSSKELTPIRLSQSRKSKLDLQFYFSPTISYRRLADNKYGNANQRNIPLASNYLNINRFVDHNPSIGAEFGSNVLWKAGRNFTIKTGLQLNYSRYSIKAYKFYFEKASIALNPVGRSADTLTSYTSFRNFSGYSPELLQNQYLQVSMPIGAEVKIIGNKRLQFNVAGTIQPSYLLFNDTYLLSTDYVNYAKEPSLVQKWNIHTSFETFISYKVGGVRWQVGPQFRYQMLSTYNDRYPIKEYLMEYGVKVGVSKTLK